MNDIYIIRAAAKEGSGAPRAVSVRGAMLLFERVTEQQPLIIESRMGENGAIFREGLESAFSRFRFRRQTTITLAKGVGVWWSDNKAAARKCPLRCKLSYFDICN